MAAGPVTHSWRRIDSWLRDCAPRTFRAQPPPATRGEIAAAEVSLGLTFPEQLTASLLCHNGGDQLRLPCVYSLLSADEIVDHQRLQVEIENDTRAEYLAHGIPLEIGGRYARWHPAWIPFAGDAGGGYLVLDTRPGPCRGRVGTRDEIGRSEFPPGSTRASLAGFLEAVADALEGNEMLDGYEPTVEDGALSWRTDG
ncbi:SMI1/KNR4 family protein [Streptomyces longisporoflavus]|uniref:SMI1/KNR4 family protein n=1 Tax=Streptomyces longisporoflavus TaxID=28044 RepID=A0ABW7QIK4_9ACTN